MRELRGVFYAEHGRTPEKTMIEKVSPLGKRAWRDVIKIAPSRFAKTKSRNLAGGKTREKESLVEVFVRRIFGIRVLKSSEWRRLKKDYRNSRRDPPAV